ncbi:MAG: hypothetical protein JXQ83_09695 [Candidatus Glassbacteria bacterium]|nr:hypothetical protein [Candidatus Glassbacteria bacterium]
MKNTSTPRDEIYCFGGCQGQGKPFPV